MSRAHKHLVKKRSPGCEGKLIFHIAEGRVDFFLIPYSALIRESISFSSHQKTPSLFTLFCRSDAASEGGQSELSLLEKKMKNFWFFHIKTLTALADVRCYFKKYIYLLLIWLHWVLVVARGIFAVSRESFAAAHRLSSCSTKGSRASAVAACRLSCLSECEILVPQPGTEPTSPAPQGRVFTSGPSGKPPEAI